MLIADSHEFIELYRGDKDVRVGIELLKLGKCSEFVSFAPDMASPVDQARFNCKYMKDIGLPKLPNGFNLQLLSSRAIRFKKKESGGIVSLMPGYGAALKAAKPDVVFENPYSWLTPRSFQTYHYSKKFNVPVVYYDPGDDIPISRKHRIMAHWESPIVRHASAIITYNEAGRNRFMEKYNYPDEKIYVIPKPVDVAACRYDGDTSELRKSFGASKDTLIVGYVGRLAEYKGSSLLLDVAREALHDMRYKNVLFVFVGGALASSEKESDYRLPNTYVTGMVPHDQVPKYIAACDVVAYPERNSDFGGFSTSIAETMAAGKAIIFGTKTPGFYVPLKNNVSAKIVPPCDPSAVSRALLDLLDNRDMVTRLGASVGKYALENMDYSVVASRYYDILQAAINDYVITE